MMRLTDGYHSKVLSDFPIVSLWILVSRHPSLHTNIAGTYKCASPQTYHFIVFEFPIHSVAFYGWFPFNQALYRLLFAIYRQISGDATA